MKFEAGVEITMALGRTPQGVRGLKYIYLQSRVKIELSHPARGAWIEMPGISLSQPMPDVAPRKGCVD